MVCPLYLFSTNIAPVSNKTPSSNDNYLFQCGSRDGKISCSPENKGKYNETTNMLYYDFTFNSTIHAGRFLRIKTNSTCASEDVKFYPLRQRGKLFGRVSLSYTGHIPYSGQLRSTFFQSYLNVNMFCCLFV